MAAAGPCRLEYRCQRKHHPDEVWRQFISGTGEFSHLPFERRSSAALFGQRQNPIRVRNEQIRVFTAEGYATLPLRTMPVSPDLQNIIVDGDYYPFSGTYGRQ